MTDVTPTADLVDTHGDALQSCDTQLRSFGRRRRFSGEVVTVRCREDNALLKQVLGEPGTGKVLVVDGGGSVHTALVGDVIGALAVSNGWEGLVVHGAIRDSALIDDLELGVKALGTNPRKSSKDATGERDVVVAFGGAVFTPGRTLVSDEDGVVVLPA